MVLVTAFMQTVSEPEMKETGQAEKSPRPQGDAAAEIASSRAQSSRKTSQNRFLRGDHTDLYTIKRDRDAAWAVRGSLKSTLKESMDIRGQSRAEREALKAWGGMLNQFNATQEARSHFHAKLQNMTRDTQATVRRGQLTLTQRMYDDHKARMADLRQLQLDSNNPEPSVADWYYARMGMGNPEAKLQLGPAQTSNDSGQNANLSQTLGEAWRTEIGVQRKNWLSAVQATVKQTLLDVRVKNYDERSVKADEIESVMNRLRSFDQWDRNFETTLSDINIELYHHNGWFDKMHVLPGIASNITQRVNEFHKEASVWGLDDNTARRDIDIYQNRSRINANRELGWRHRRRTRNKTRVTEVSNSDSLAARKWARGLFNNISVPELRLDDMSKSQSAMSTT